MLEWLSFLTRTTFPHPSKPLVSLSKVGSIYLVNILWEFISKLYFPSDELIHSLDSTTHNWDELVLSSFFQTFPCIFNLLSFPFPVCSKHVHLANWIYTPKQNFVPCHKKCKNCLFSYVQVACSWRILLPQVVLSNQQQRSVSHCQFLVIILWICQISFYFVFFIVTVGYNDDAIFCMGKLL